MIRGPSFPLLTWAKHKSGGVPTEAPSSKTLSHHQAAGPLTCFWPCAVDRSQRKKNKVCARTITVDTEPPLLANTQRCCPNHILLTDLLFFLFKKMFLISNICTDHHDHWLILVLISMWEKKFLLVLFFFWISVNEYEEHHLICVVTWFERTFSIWRFCECTKSDRCEAAINYGSVSLSNIGLLITTIKTVQKPLRFSAKASMNSSRPVKVQYNLHVQVHVSEYKNKTQVGQKI